jgi:hypothetical protein
VLIGDIAVTTGIIGVLPNATATVNGALTVSGGTIGGPGSLSITGNGSSLTWTGGTIDGFNNLLIGAGRQMQISGALAKTLSNSTLTNQGSITWSGSDITSFSCSINNMGSFVVSSDASIVRPQGGFGGGQTISTFTNNNQGTFHKTNGFPGGVTALNVAFTNAGGSFTIDPTLNVSFPNSSTFTQTSGITNLTGGTLTVVNGFTVQAGLVSAYGMIDGDFNIGGDLNLGGGNQVKTLTVTGNFTQTGGTVTFKVAANNTADNLVVQGTNPAQLAGNLLISPVGAYVPAQNDTFDVLTAAGGFQGTYQAPNGYAIQFALTDLIVKKN